MPEPSNVVLLLSDEHNPFYASPYGDNRVDTPNMQRMADKGVLFKNAYCPSPLCLPCRAAFTAGRYVHEIQAYNNSNVNLGSGFASWGRALDEQGIRSIMVGKVDAYAPSSDLGYTEEIVTGNRQYPGDTHVDRKPMAVRHGAGTRSRGYGPRSDPHPHDDIVINNAIQWLESKSRSEDRPFVLAVNIIAPHFPHFCSDRLWRKYASTEDLPRFRSDQASARHPRAVEQRLHFESDSFPQSDIRGLRRGYYACIDYVDQQLGRIMETLDRLGLSESTNLVYASDHGEMLGKFGMWWKCSLYEDSARIPIIAMGPGFSGGRTIETPVNLLDVQAEFFASTGAVRPANMKGRPLSSIGSLESDAFAFSEYHGHGASESAYLIRKGDWKLIYHINAEHQLFNLAEDPDELSNRYGEVPGIAADLEKDLRSICDPERENERAHEFVQRQAETIAQDGLAYGIYDRNIGSP